MFVLEQEILKWALRAIMGNTKKLNFFPKFSSDKITLCNNSDQTLFSHKLASARPLRGLSGLGFNTILGVQQMLNHRNHV